MKTQIIQQHLPSTHHPGQFPAPVPAVIDVDPDEVPIPLAHYLWILRRHLWKILGFVAVATALALIVSLRLTPVYESTATVDIDFRTPTGIVGDEAAQTYRNDADQFLATQVELIESDSVLRPVAENYRLLERPEELGELPPEELALAWESPIELTQLRVRRPSNTYLLDISYRSQDRELSADVANAIADSYLQHSYNIRYRAAAGLSTFMERQLEELKAKMERSSSALAEYESELSIINPGEQTNILSARLLDLNSEFTRAQADRVNKEAAYRSVQEGSLDAAQTSSQSEALRKLTEDYNVARENFAEIRAHYGPNHPEYKVAAAKVAEIEGLLTSTGDSIGRRVDLEYRRALDREQMLSAELKASKDEFDRLNASSFEYQALQREAEGDKSLYEELLRKIKEETINASFQNSSIRIANPARPDSDPVFPNVPLNVALTFVFASLFAVGIAVVSDVLDDTIRDPEQVNRTLGTHVVGSLPEVKPWRNQLATIIQGPNGNQNGNGNGAGHRNGSSSSLTTYEEAVRTLRNSILLTDFDRRLRTMLVTSASPSEGKSTIAIHLAVAHAEQDKRTLVIDGDLRKPSVHKRFDIKAKQGLSDVLMGNAEWESVVVPVESTPGLDVIPAGQASPRRAADFIGQGLQAIIDEAQPRYDLIVVDAPPLLGFPEPLQMASVVDGVVVVARAGQTSRKAVGQVLHTLQRLRANVVGLVLNEITRNISNSYYYHGYYRKYYGDDSRRSRTGEAA